jgi:hypothetical protein
MLQHDTRTAGRGGMSHPARPYRSSVIYRWSHAPAVADNPAAARCSDRQRLGVDPKTVEHWITNGRLRIVRIAGQQRSCWAPMRPTCGRRLLTTSAEVGSDAEFFHSYAHRGAIPASLWQSLLDRAINSIDVLIFSAYSCPTTTKISLTGWRRRSLKGSATVTRHLNTRLHHKSSRGWR